MTESLVDGEVIEYARDCYQNSFENLLDDPSFVIQDHDDEPPNMWFDHFRSLGKKMMLDFDQMIKDHPNDYERDRILKMVNKTDWTLDSHGIWR